MSVRIPVKTVGKEKAGGPITLIGRAAPSDGSPADFQERFSAPASPGGAVAGAPPFFRGNPRPFPSFPFSARGIHHLFPLPPATPGRTRPPRRVGLQAPDLAPLPSP